MKETCMKSMDGARGVEQVRASRAHSLNNYVVVALFLALLCTAGCRTLFERERDSARFEPNRGRYVSGADATDDWTTAREESSAELRSLRASKGTGTFKDYDNLVTTRGAEGEESLSWNQRVKKVFTLPSFPSRKDAHPDDFGARNRSAYDTAELRGNRDFEKGYSQQNPKKGFWSSLFERHGSQPEVQPKVVEDSDLIMNRQGGAVSVPSTNRERSFLPGTTRAKSGSERYGTTLSIFGKRPNRARPDYRVQRLTSFSTNDFIPPVSLIRVYYSLDSVAVDPRARTGVEVVERRIDDSQRLQKRVKNSPARMEETATTRQGGYRSRSYAPVDSDKVDDELPDSPRHNDDSRFGAVRQGSATLSPINHETNQDYRTVKRSQKMGSTRPISNEIARRENDGSSIAQTSFAQPVATQRVGISVQSNSLPKVDSLFGWTDDGKVILASFTSNRARKSKSGSVPQDADVDPVFKKALGSQSSFAWFDSTDEDNRTEEVLETERVVSRPAVSETTDAVASTGQDEGADPTETEWTESTFDMTPFGRQENVPESASRSSDVSNSGSTDETASPIEAGNIEVGSVDSQVSDSADELVATAEYEDELDDVVDQAFAFSSNQTNASETAEPVVEEAFKKADESLLSRIDDLASHSALDNSTDTEINDEAPSALVSSPLGMKETPEVANLKTSEPETLNARKADAVAAPLTEEEIAWVEQIKRAIASLLKEREEHKRLGDDSRVCDARLRLLYLVIGEYDRSIREIQDDDDPLKTFWEKECRGLETLLQNQLEEIDPTFVAERLRLGLDSFSGLCNIQIRKALLATAPACFGLFEERIAPYSSGDMVYAYAELDYVTSVETSSGYEINVECRWRLLDSAGTEVLPFETQHCVNYSETKLRDVVLNVSVPLPNDLAPGEYFMELEVVDLNSTSRSTAFKRLKIVVSNADAE